MDFMLICRVPLITAKILIWRFNTVNLISVSNLLDSGPTESDGQGQFDENLSNLTVKTII